MNKRNHLVILYISQFSANHSLKVKKSEKIDKYLDFEKEQKTWIMRMTLIP